jgi:hypothetical protein
VGPCANKTGGLLAHSALLVVGSRWPGLDGEGRRAYAAARAAHVVQRSISDCDTSRQDLPSARRRGRPRGAAARAFDGTAPHCLRRLRAAGRRTP